MAGGIVQYTGQWVIDQLKRLQAEGNQRLLEIRMLNGRIVDADKRAQGIADRTLQAKVRGKLHELALEQGKTMQRWRSFWGRIEKLSSDGIAWLRSNGYSTTGLGGLPLAPFALAGALVIGAVIWKENDRMKQEIALREKQWSGQKQLVDAYVAGQISEPQFQQSSTVLMAQTNAQIPAAPDPFGLANLSKALMPIALVALGFVVLPPLLQSFNSRTRRLA